MISSRAAARVERERRIALSHPLRVERIRAVHRLHRRERVAGFFRTPMVAGSLFAIAFVCLIGVGLLWVKGLS